MTVGEKIKYCRCRCQISQAKLAELSDISLVSIKRYETNKMIPTKPQIEKLSNALGIGVLAFSDTNFDCLKELETYGDLVRILIIFRKNNLLFVEGERAQDGQLNLKTAKFKLNPVIGKFFKSINSEECLVTDLAFRLVDEYILNKFLEWENVYTKFETLYLKYCGSDDTHITQQLMENEDVLDKIELELQYDSRMLERTNGRIAVKVNLDYGNEENLVKKREKAMAKELKSQKSQAKKSRQKKDDKK